MPPIGERHEGRWARARLSGLPLVLSVLAAYGMFRVGAVVWGVVRDGLPTSSLGWSAFAGDTAAARQALAVVGLLAVPRLRGWVSAGVIAAVGIGAALFDAGLWAAVGGEGEGVSRHARQLVLAVGFAVFAAGLCRWRIGWALRSDGSYDLAAVNRVLRRTAGCAVVLAAAAAGAMVAVDRPGVPDRLLSTVAALGIACAASAVLVLLPIIGEQRREERETAMAAVFEGLERYSADEVLPDERQGHGGPRE